MSATRPSRPRPHEHAASPAPRDIARLRARRREANRRRRLLRVISALCVAVALILLLATPGLAIAAILAGVLLLACAISLALQRRSAGRGSVWARCAARPWLGSAPARRRPREFGEPALVLPLAGEFGQAAGRGSSTNTAISREVRSS